MVDSEYSIEDYKPPRISIVAIMKNSEMLKVIPYNVKTKKHE